MTIADKHYPLPSLLSQWLSEAKEAHTTFEKVHGVDPHWEDWYALFLRYRMDGVEQGIAAGWSTLDMLSERGKR